MNTSNIAKGYVVFTGNVDESDTASKWYGEFHTGGTWLLARDGFALPMMKILMTCLLD